MALKDEVWQPVTVHHMHASFLLGERDKALLRHPNVPPALIDSPNLTDPAQNAIRMRLLYGYGRAYLLGEVPLDTAWHQVRFTNDHLDELRVIGRVDSWASPNDRIELRRVAARNPIKLTAPPSKLSGFVFWGHTKEGPFTILEGNHRLVACACEPQLPAFEVSVHVGLSQSYCFWHLDDPGYVLLNDMWRL